ncbi:hypothetical protein [Nitrospira sp. M1]
MVDSHSQIPSEKTDQKPQSVTYFLIFLLLIIQLLWFLKGPVPLLEGGLVGSDSYMHLNRVVQLVESGEWFSSVYPRSNAPYGETLHWTRLMDILLISGASVASIVVPFSTALHWWGVLLSPVLQIVALVSLVWVMRPIFDREHQLLAGGVFLFHPALLQSFFAGRPDHHGFLVVCFIVLLGLTFRIMTCLPFARWCVFAGIVATGAIWASVESLVALSVCISVLAMGWVWYGQDWGIRNLIVTSTLSVLTCVALLVDRGIWQFFHDEYDRFSVVHWSVLSLIASFWIVMCLVERLWDRRATSLHRLLLGIIGIVVVLSIQWMLFPKFFQGPLVDVDPQFITLFWNRIAETQPLISTEFWQFGRFILYLGIALPAIPYLIWLVFKESNDSYRLFWLLIAVGIFVFLPLTLHEMRWAAYAELLMVFPYTHLMGRVLQRIAGSFSMPWIAVVKMSIVFVSAMWFLLVGAKMIEAEDHGVSTTTSHNCPVIPLSKYLNDPAGFGRQNQMILAFVDFGPELLYRTSHHVIMTPYHRNVLGNLDGFQILSDSTGNLAKRLLQTRGVDLILTCPSSPAESSFFQSPDNPLSLYDRLNQGRFPQWIREVNLPASLDEHFKLFQVQKNHKDPT